MASRAIWSGSITFGLVNIPVKLVSAVSPKGVRFHQLHEKDGVRIRMKRVCPADGEEVAYEHLVKGYEVAPDRYVVIRPEELEQLAPEMTHTVDIEDFVDLADIDPLFYDHPYYLVPGRGAAKAYALLLEAMRRSAKVAIGRVVLRSKQYLCAIRAVGEALSLTTLLYADEVVPAERLDELPGKGAVSERELAMAEQLIGQLSAPFEPERYHDEYRERVLELIEAKAHGQEVVTQPAPAAPAPVIDLVAALEASLGQRGGEGESQRSAGRPERHARGPDTVKADAGRKKSPRAAAGGKTRKARSR